MKILVINAGSSSLKFQLEEESTHAVIARGLCERIGIAGSKINYKPGIEGKTATAKEAPMVDHADAIKLVIEALTDPENGVIADMSEIGAVGHRVVHGGEKFAESVLITDEVIAEIEKLSDLAPLHNPANLLGIRACREVMPNVPMVAAFDTAFHQTMTPEAFLYGLPYKDYTELMVRRYGFHGTSHLFVSQQAAKMLDKPVEETRIITCHLGNGSSITAVKGGKSVDTSMGFTPLEGVPMGTRCGDMDPAIVTYLMEKRGLDAAGMNAYMNKKSGMLGVSGISSDFRDLDAACEEGNPRAAAALNLFTYNVKKYIGSYAAAMGGVDAIVFTAGVGENDRHVRAEILEGLEFLGVMTDYEYNKTCPRGENVTISKPDSPVKVFVIPTNEELVIASDTARLARS